MEIIALEWKEFQVNLDKVNIYLKNHLSSNYDGLICDENNLNVAFKETISEEDQASVETYWDEAEASDFVPTLDEIISKKINDASLFGNQLIAQASVENVKLGITQAGKTKLVADFFGNLQRYLEIGSLYAAIDEINRLISEGIDSSLNPYVTEARLNEYKTKIQAFLSG